jgi:hypothetical protein
MKYPHVPALILATAAGILLGLLFTPTQGHLMSLMFRWFNATRADIYVSWALSSVPSIFAVTFVFGFLVRTHYPLIHGFVIGLIAFIVNSLVIGEVAVSPGFLLESVLLFALSVLFTYLGHLLQSSFLRNRSQSTTN